MINNITNKTKNKNVDISDYLQDEIKHNTIEQTVTTTHKNISNYINIVDMLNNKALIDTLHVFNPASLYKKTYLPLDSRNTYANTNYKLSWYITNSQNIRTGFINVRNKLRDIVCIRLMNCFIYSPFIFIRQISIPDTRQNYSTKRLAFYINDLVQQILAENNHIVYTSKLALNRTTDLPSELQQYITDFVKLRGI
jgi:hypothetical protein